MTPQNKNAPIAKSNESATNHKSNHSIKPFVGTSNASELRAIDAFIKAKGRQVSRKDLDRACASTNSPEIVRRLRGKGLPIECELKSTANRFGEPVQAGFYSLTPHAYEKLHLWLSEKSGEVQK